jgi:hypothetical protein
MKLRKGHDGGADPTEPDNHEDDVVELTRIAFIAEAVAIQQDLERIGIRASVFQADAGGWAPFLAIGQGHRVMVRAGDLARAQQVLSAVGGQEPAELEPTTLAMRKHLRHHGDEEAAGTE